MNALTHALDIRGMVRSDEMKPTVILILSALLLTAHRYFGSMEFASRLFVSASEFERAAFMFVTAFILLGVIPAIVSKKIFKDSLNNYGIGFGDWKTGLRLTAILFPIIAITLLYPASQTSEMRLFYPFDKHAGDSYLTFLRFEVIRGVFFYTAWEFFFRGFMLFGLRKYVGDWLAICIQTIPSCLWHIGMPTGEIFSSIAGGILFGVLALRTNSILWPLLLHYLIGVGLDFFIVITL